MTGYADENKTLHSKQGKVETSRECHQRVAQNMKSNLLQKRHLQTAISCALTIFCKQNMHRCMIQCKQSTLTVDHRYSSQVFFCGLSLTCMYLN